MTKHILLIPLLAGCLLAGMNGFAQSPAQSENIVKYDWRLPNNSKLIPFDRAFTMVVDKIPAKAVTGIFAFETEYKAGNRVRKTDLKKPVPLPVNDIRLSKDLDSDTLKIFFPALKPNKNFDIYILRLLADDNRSLVMKANLQLQQGKRDEARATFARLRKNTEGKYAGLSPMAIGFSEYEQFYNMFLAGVYNDLCDSNNFPSAPALTAAELTTIDVTTSGVLDDFKDAPYLLEAIVKGLLPQLQNGTLAINKVYQAGTETAEPADVEARTQNIESNRLFFDSVYKRIGAAVSKGHNLGALPGKTDAIRLKIAAAKDRLDKGRKKINAIIDVNANMRQMDFLSGTTESYDLKTAGGNVLFLDAGLSNIFATGVNGKNVNIPKLYWGASIYFRPIDKNTRRNRFPWGWELPRHKGYVTDTIRLNNNRLMATYMIDTLAQPDYSARAQALALVFNDALVRVNDSTCTYQTAGPDYNIVSRVSILQHLCLNVGITLGSMGNKEFDNLYNNTSLLIGPALRFARGFKISGGAAFVKRSSTHPLMSDKRIVVGPYVSLSTDIDFIQGLKDITSILFK